MRQSMIKEREERLAEEIHKANKRPAEEEVDDSPTKHVKFEPVEMDSSLEPEPLPQPKQEETCIDCATKGKTVAGTPIDWWTQVREYPVR